MNQNEDPLPSLSSHEEESGDIIDVAVVEGKEGGRRLIVPVVLFLLTIGTTLLAGAYQEGGRPWSHPEDIIKGIPFSFTLLSILFVHEMGHYLTAQQYGVSTTLPYFVPGPWFPFGIGTFGAFIRIQSPILRKQALLDIGAAGPIAGFVVSVVAIVVGLSSPETVIREQFSGGLQLGDPLAFTFIATVLGKTAPAGYDIAIGSVAFAGWIGLFVTSLNLLPIGQLDGGHIVYALLGRRQRWVSITMIFVLILLGMFGWSGWYTWAFLSLVLGVRHPPIVDEEVPLDFKHQWIVFGSVLLFIVTFMPVPFKSG